MDPLLKLILESKEIKFIISPTNEDIAKIEAYIENKKFLERFVKIKLKGKVEWILDRTKQKFIFNGDSDDIFKVKKFVRESLGINIDLI